VSYLLVESMNNNMISPLTNSVIENSLSFFFVFVCRGVRKLLFVCAKYLSYAKVAR
jgi:hypothetical protein